MRSALSIPECSGTGRLKGAAFTVGVARIDGNEPLVPEMWLEEKKSDRECQTVNCELPFVLCTARELKRLGRQCRYKMIFLVRFNLWMDMGPVCRGFLRSRFLRCTGGCVRWSA